MLSPERRSEILFQNIDTSDCGVIAIQAVTGWRRETAEKRMLKAGYSKEGGAPRGTLEKVLAAHGFKNVVYRKVDPREPQATPATFAMVHEYGLWLVYVESHVMALVDGNLHNASPKHWHARVEAYSSVVR